MLEFLRSSTPEQMTVFLTGIGSIIGGCLIALRGALKGNPSSAAIANAVAVSNCRIFDIAPQVQAISGQLAIISKDQDEISKLINELRLEIARLGRAPRR